jgi:hypothetical protein
MAISDRRDSEANPLGESEHAAAITAPVPGNSKSVRRDSLTFVSVSTTVSYTLKAEEKFFMIMRLPRTYAEAVDRLIAGLTPDGREALLDFSEEELARQHSGLAMRLREDYGLREGNSELLRSCAEQAGQLAEGQIGIFDADAAAHLIVRGAREKLRSESS